MNGIVALQQAQASAKQLYAPRRGLRPVALNTHVPTRSGSSFISDGVSTGITSRFSHTVITACTGVRLLFANWYDNAGTPADGLNPITVKCYVKTLDGATIPVLFGGAQTVSIVAGNTVVSDPLGYHFARGDSFISQTYVSVNAGEKYPLGLTTDSVQLEGVVSGDNASGSVAASTTKGYSPWAVLGVPTKPLASPNLLIVGDSRTAGYGDTKGTSDAYGWVRRAFDSQLSYLNIAVSGSTAQNASTLGNLRRRLLLADHCLFDTAIVVYGINDLAAAKTAVQIEAWLTSIYGFLAARGLKVYGATLSPVSTTTDNWQTLANQTTATWNAERVALNAWIRSTPSPLAGYLELADPVESARDSGKWKVTGSSFGYTADGTHESIGGYTAEAATLTPSAFGPVLTS